MYIDELKIEVFDNYWDSKKKDWSKDKDVVASHIDSSGIGIRDLSRLLDDLYDHHRFRGNIKMHITVEKGDE